MKDDNSYRISNRRNSDEVNANNKSNEIVAPVENKAQSAGPPGSAGMVGSKRWLKSNNGNTRKESE